MPKPDLGEIRDQLDRAIAAALPHSGGRVRPLLEALAAELAAVDARAPTLMYDPTTGSVILPANPPVTVPRWMVDGSTP